MSGPHLSVVVLSWNTRSALRECLSALERDVSARPRQVIVVDNGSADGSAEMVAEEFPAVVLVRNPDNRLYAEANNQGAHAADGRFLCLLNSDTEVRPGALDGLCAFLETHPEHGAVAPKLLDPDGSVQRACRRFPTLLQPLLDSTLLGACPPGRWLTWWTRMGYFDHGHSRDVPQPPGACLVLRRSEYLELGGLDPDLSLFFNDVDLCRRLWRKGRRIHYLAQSEVLHHEGLSTRSHHARRRNLLWTRNRAAFYRKHYGRPAGVWMRIVLELSGLECSLGIRLGSKSPEAKRLALAELREFQRECRRL